MQYLRGERKQYIYTYAGEKVIFLTLTFVTLKF